VIMAKLANSDLLPVGRGAATFKATFQDVKDSVYPPDASVTTLGIVQLADATETAAGVDHTKAVTSAGVASGYIKKNIGLLPVLP